MLAVGSIVVTASSVFIPREYYNNTYEFLQPSRRRLAGQAIERVFYRPTLIAHYQPLALLCQVHGAGV